MAKPTVKELTPLKISQQYIRDNLHILNSVFRRAAVGDFSTDVQFPDEETEFMEVYVGVQVMLEVIREKIDALKAVNASLEQELWERDVLVDKFKKNETRLASATANYRALISSIGEGVIATDRHAVISFVNPVAEKILGRPAHTLQGHKLTDVLEMRKEDGSVVPAHDRPLSKALRFKKQIQTSYASYVKRDGSLLPIVYTNAPIIQRGKLLGAIAVFRDISTEKEFDRVKSEFVSLASHQLRTPLTAINWYASRLSASTVGPLSKKQREYVNEIEQGGKRMASLVTALLQTSRIELGTFMQKPQPVNIRQVLKEVVAAYHPKLDKKRIVLNERYTKSRRTVFIDENIVKMIIQNIIDNAIKYTPAGGKVTIQLQIPSQKQRKQEVKIIVRDTGYGIPVSQQDKVFHKLFRADNVKALDTDGTGLGLYIVKSLVEHVGGSVELKSKVAKGTTLSVRLPLQQHTPQPVQTINI